jgi:hypothetical protein
VADTSSKFFRPPTGAEHRATYMHGFIDGCNAGREEALALIATSKSETIGKVIDPELERRRQIAEVEILEADARIRKAVAETREFYAKRRKPAAVP